MLWYTREASVAVYIANLPGIWPLLREHICFLRERTNSYIKNESHLPQYGYGSQYGNLSKYQRSRLRTTVANIESDEMELKNSYNKPGVQWPRSSPWSESGELGVVFGKANLDNDQRVINELRCWKGMSVIEVKVDTMIEIQRDSWDGSKSEGLATTTQIEGGRQQ